MISETIPLYSATFMVVPAGAGSSFGHEVLVVAKDFEAARLVAEPTVGYYSFELTKLERVGDVGVTW